MANLVLNQWVQIASRSVDVTTTMTTTMNISLWAKLKSQDIVNNKSRVELALDYSWNVWTACYRTDFYLNGSWKGYGDRVFGSSYYNFEQWPLSGTLMRDEVTITHNSDGTKSFTVTGGYEFAYNGHPPTTFSGTATLPKINRGVTAFTCNPQMLTVTGDSSIVFTVTDAISRQHNLTITVGNYSQSVKLNAGTNSYTWKPSKDIRDKIGTGPNIVAKAVVTTNIATGVVDKKEVRFGLVMSDMATAKISMENGCVTFNLNGIFASFDGLFGNRTPIATKVALQLNQNGSIPILPFMEIDKITLSKDTWNQLVDGDVIKIDTEEATIYKNNSIDHRLGALGNDYETFVLVPGQNQIQCLASDWIDTQPEFKLKYREVFL